MILLLNRATRLPGLAVAFLVSTGLAHESHAGEQPFKPNIIFVVADDMDFKDTGYSGKAKNIPFALSCGELDTAKAFDGKAPYGRLEWMQVFAEDLKKRGFAVRTEVHPNTGHGGSTDTHGPLIHECFLLATEGIIPKNNKWSGDLKQFTRHQAAPALPGK